MSLIDKPWGNLPRMVNGCVLIVSSIFFDQICRQLSCMRCSVKKIVINKKEDCDT